MSIKILIVGLGNPGYEKTVHNMGSFILNTHLKNIQVNNKNNYMVNKEINNIYYYDGGNKNITYYMNESGIPIKKIIDFNNIKNENVYVIFDDIRIDMGKYKIMKGNVTHYGHNGLKSIINSIGNSFTLIRIGVGPKPSLMDLKDFVLSKVKGEDLLKISLLSNEIFIYIYKDIQGK